MFEKLRNDWRMRRQGLLPLLVARAEASKSLVQVLRDLKDSPATFVRFMREDAKWVKLWQTEFFPRLDKALDKPTPGDQLKGLRGLILDCQTHMALATWYLYETGPPDWKERPDEDRIIIKESVDATLPRVPPPTLADVENTEKSALVVYHAGLVVTTLLAHKFFRDDSNEYTETFELLAGRLVQLRLDKILSEAKRAPFDKELHLKRIELLMEALRPQIVEGRNVPLDEMFRNLIG